MIIVFCIPSDFDKNYIEKATQQTQKVRVNLDKEKIESRNKFIEDAVLKRGNEIGIYDLEEFE